MRVVEAWRRRGARWIIRTPLAAEVAMLSAAGAAVYLLLARAEAFEALYALSRRHEAWDLDEIVLAICCLGLASLVFVLRRWRDEHRARVEIEHLKGELEQALRAAAASDQAKSAFLSNLSHELRTPLNAVIGFAEALQHGINGPVENPRHRDYIDGIRLSGGHLLDLIDELLDLTRLEVQGKSVERVAVPVRALVEETLRLFPPPVRAGRRVDTTVARDAGDARVLTDARLARQVLLNVLSNAFKHTADHATVRVRIEREPDGAVAIQVTDDGPGFAPEVLADPFVRFRNGGGRSLSGDRSTGLGLGIAHRIMTLLGAGIAIDNAPEGGARVRLVLPAA